MIPALRSVAPARTAAAPLPWVPDLRLLYEQGATFRRGQLIMLAGYPGSMKSAFAMWLCNEWNLPTLYLCADMSNHTATTRLASLRSGMSHDAVSQALADNSPASGLIEQALSESRMSFIFDDAPTLLDIEEELAAWVELYDDYPPILVIDNLVDLDNEGADEFAAWRQTLLWFKGLCRDYGITVIVLHHARELAKSDYPAPRKDIQGKVSQTPELTLTVSLTPKNEFRIAVVKNRAGRQDAMAREGVEFLAIPNKMAFAPRNVFYRPDRE